MHSRPLTDSESLSALVRAAAARDDRAWEALYARFSPTLRAAARGFRLCPADVDDVVQQTWLAALRHIHTIEKPEAICGWLLVTARREALRTMQRRVREVLTDELPEHAVPDAVPPESELIKDEERRAVQTAVRRLHGRKQLVLDALLRTPDASYVDLAERLQMPIGSVGPTRERALERLRSDRDLVATVA
jgi:RNA polymerase sigma factor (sigma-70 family)